MEDTRGFMDAFSLIDVEFGFITWVGDHCPEVRLLPALWKEFFVINHEIIANQNIKEYIGANR